MDEEKNNKKLDIKRIKVGKFGHFDVELPFVKLGSGNPKLSIITGMHGDEYSGLLILKYLLDEIEVKKGTLQIILSANPLARAQKKRECYTDLLDLNRIFPGKQEGSITERIAHKILSIIGDSDLFIDLHTMLTRVTPTVIHVSCGNLVDSKTLEYIKSFNHEKVWKIETTKEQVYGQSLCAFLSRQMIPNFAVEMDNIEKISDLHLQNIIGGLKSVMSKLGMINGQINSCEPKYFKRIKVHGNHSGIFIPLKDVDFEINEGDIVAQILDIDDFQFKYIKASQTGFVCDIGERQFVTEGDHIFSLGVREVIK